MRSESHRPYMLTGAALVCLLIGGAPAFAQTHIGGAVVVQNDVRGQTLKLTQGDRVFQNERINTGADGLAKLMLLDETNVSLGPSSQLTLARFVDAPAGGATQVTLNADKGAFRFIAGRSSQEAYEVRTPQATIGVRGATYDVRVLGGRTTIVLQEGAAHICRGATQICADLTEPGESLVVTGKALEGPITPRGKTWDFASLCGRSSELCVRTTQFVFNNNAPPEPQSASAPKKQRLAAPAPVRRPNVNSLPQRERIATGDPLRRARAVRRYLPIYDDEEIIIERRRRFGAAPYRLVNDSIGFGRYVFGPTPIRGRIGEIGR